MSRSRDGEKPKLSKRGKEEAAERQRRRADLLRENLLKRKAQRRDRAGGESSVDGGPEKGAAR